jgi:hypothetical protein
MKDIFEAEVEVDSIISDNTQVSQRLEKLQKAGYNVQLCWIKKSGVGLMTHMKRKKEYRIQVASPEVHGRFPKAYCVVLPEKNNSNKNK